MPLEYEAPISSDGAIYSIVVPFMPRWIVISNQCSQVVTLFDGNVNGIIACNSGAIVTVPANGRRAFKLQAAAPSSGPITVLFTSGELVSNTVGASSPLAPAGPSTPSLVLDTTLADYQPVATATAVGTTGKAADAGHTHQGVHSLTAISGVNASGANGDVTISNTGVLSLSPGTAISLSGSTGNITVGSTIALKHLSSFITVDATGTVGTWVSSGASIALTAGTWFIHAHLTATSATTAFQVQVRIRDVTGAVTLATGELIATTSGTNLSPTIALGAVLVLAANHTIELDFNSTATVVVAKAQLVSNADGNTATGIAAIGL